MSEKETDLQPDEMQSPDESATPEDVTTQTTDTSTMVADDAADAKDDDEVTQLSQQLLRAHADFDNFRKRTRQEKEDLQKFATKRVLEDLLPVLDNFERALPALSGTTPEVRQGIEMVHRQLAGVLEGNGVVTMDPVGQPFDPKVHEAVMQAPAEGSEPGTVLEVLQRGYTLHDKVLRPAMVKVAE